MGKHRLPPPKAAPLGYSSSPQLWVRYVTLGRRPGPHRLPVWAIDLLPTLLDQFDDTFRHWNVVELFGHLASVVIGPVEEIQLFARAIGLGLLLLHQNESGPGNRPAVLAGLIRQQQVAILRLRPVGIRR